MISWLDKASNKKIYPDILIIMISLDGRERFCPDSSKSKEIQQRSPSTIRGKGEVCFYMENPIVYHMNDTRKKTSYLKFYFRSYRKVMLD